MENYRSMSRSPHMVVGDCSGENFRDDSEKIKGVIVEEIINGEYDKPIHYHGILEEKPDLEKITNGCKYKVHTADNCVFPEKYNNVLVYVTKDRVIHWFVVVKEIVSNV